MNRRLWLAMGLMLLTGVVLGAEGKKVEPTQTWQGSVEVDTDLKKPSAVLQNEDDWKELWKSWKLEGETPEIDFEKQLVLVETTVGSRLNVTLLRSEAGDLKVLALATRDLRPGFRYVLAAVDREGIQTINGKPLDKE